MKPQTSVDEYTYKKFWYEMKYCTITDKTWKKKNLKVTVLYLNIF